VQKERYIPKMYLKGDSVKMQELDNAASIAMGPKMIPGLDNATAEMNALDERRVETHMLCPDHRLLQDPGNGSEVEGRPQYFVDSIGSEDPGTNIKDSFRGNKIEEKPDRWDAHKDGTQCKNNGATSLYRKIFGIFNEYTHSETNFGQQRQVNGRQARIDHQRNPNAALQQGSIRSAEEETKIGTFDTNERRGMGLPNIDKRIRDDTYSPANEVSGQKDDLPYGNKTASKWNGKTRIHIPGEIVTQRLYPLRNIILEKMDDLMPTPIVTDEAPDKTGTNTLI
jgi:hypothetical protein